MLKIHKTALVSHLFFKYSRYTKKNLSLYIFFQFLWSYFVNIFFLLVPCKGRRKSKKVYSRLRSVTKNVTKVIFRLRLEKRLLKLENWYLLQWGPLFCKFENRKSYYRRGWLWGRTQNLSETLYLLDRIHTLMLDLISFNHPCK